MPRISTSRLALATLALLAECIHLGWEALHGGIVSHHLLQRADMPAMSNAWGLLIVPTLAAWAAGRLPSRQALARDWLPVTLGFALPLLLGAALSTAFSLQMHALTEAIFFTLLLLALVLPAHRPECLLGFVLGMSWTFGAVIATLIGGIIGGVPWLLRSAALWLWRRARST
jgi:hypothetical protein